MPDGSYRLAERQKRKTTPVYSLSFVLGLLSLIGMVIICSLWIFQLKGRLKNKLFATKIQYWLFWTLIIIIIIIDSIMKVVPHLGKVHLSVAQYPAGLMDRLISLQLKNLTIHKQVNQWKGIYSVLVLSILHKKSAIIEIFHLWLYPGVSHAVHRAQKVNSDLKIHCTFPHQ